jgi:polysaccharide deacetylase family protein (PEP-CTERM system associated)
LGSVAAQHPELVRSVQSDGHEVASHGYGHELVSRQTRAEFYQDVKKSLDILQSITGQAVKGYRASNWSISKGTPWAYEVLAGLGLKYDASLFPYSTFLYGDSQAPLVPFAHHLQGKKLYEIPATVVEILGQRVPFSGGFTFRFLPYWAIRLAIYLTNRQGRPVVFYLHPREIDPAQPRIPLPFRDYFITYINLSSTLRKLGRVLSLAPTISIYRYLELSGLMDNDSSGGAAGEGV